MVFFNGSSTKTLDLMQKGMGYAITKSEVLNNNIANASTPNYKRHDVTFQAELGRAIDSEKSVDSVPFKVSRKRHIPLFKAKDYRSVTPKITTEFNTYQSNNGSSVDIEKEMMESTKNTLYFNALASRTASEFNKFKFLLKS